jgi:hypothetical protein
MTMAVIIFILLCNRTAPNHHRQDAFLYLYCVRVFLYSTVRIFKKSVKAS